jgi:hypothetical protein
MVSKGSKRYVIDPTRGFLNSLVNVYEALSVKNIIQTNFISEYVPGQLKHGLLFTSFTLIVQVLSVLNFC